MTLIVRLVLLLAAPIAGWMVARDSLQFGIIQTLIATILVAILVSSLAFLPVGKIIHSLSKRTHRRFEQ